MSCIVTYAQSTQTPYKYLRCDMADSYKVKDASHKIEKGGTDAALLSYTNAGDYILYKNCNFDNNATHFNVNLAAQSGYSAKIEIRLDSLNSLPVGQVDYKFTSGNWYDGEMITGEITEDISGVHDVYVYFAGGKANYLGVKFIPSVGKSAIEYLDIKDTKYDRRVSLLTQLKILPVISGDYYDLNMPITRGEYAQYIMNVMTDDKNYSAKTAFTDVSDDMECFVAVSYLYDNGIISGDGLGNYNPYDFLKLNEACVMLCKVMGYDCFVGAYGSYEKLANSIGVLKGVTAADGVVRRSTVIDILMNAIEGEYLEIVGFTIGSEQSRYEYAKEEGILSKTRSIKKGKGIISANSDTGLYSPTSKSMDDAVIIDNVTYMVGKTDAENYVGYNCDYYYFEDSTMGTLTLVAVVLDKKVSFIELNSYEPDIEIDQISTSQISYRLDGNRAKTIKFNQGNAVIFNGKALDFDLEQFFALNDFRGTITAVDNGEGYNLLLIDYYRNIMIDYVDVNTNTVRDFFTGEVYTAGSSGMKINNLNVVADVSELKRGDYATIWYSNNSDSDKKFVMTVIRDGFKGIVTGCDDKNVVIDGETYLCPSSVSSRLSVGSYVEFFVNEYNEIIDFNISSNQSILTGCLMRSYMDYVENCVAVKVLNTEGVAVTYELADKVKVDGVIENNKEIIKVALENAGQKTPIRYKLNSSSKINYIDTVLTGNNNRDDLLRKITTSGTVYYNNSKKMIFDNSKAVGPIADDTYVFGYSDTDDVRKMKAVQLSKVTNSDAFNWELYSMDSEYDVVNVIIEEDSTPVSKWESPMVFEKITSEYDVYEDELVYYVKGYRSAKQVTYKIYDDIAPNVLAVLNSLEVGDSFQPKIAGTEGIVEANWDFFNCTANKRGNTTSMCKFTAPFSESNSEYTDLSIRRYVYGEVETLPISNQSYIKVKHSNGTNEYIKCDNTPVIICEKDGTDSELTVGLSVNALKTGDKVYVSAWGGTPNFIVAYR